MLTGEVRTKGATELTQVFHPKDPSLCAGSVPCAANLDSEAPSPWFDAKDTGHALMG